MELQEILTNWLNKDMIYEGHNGMFIKNECGCVKFKFNEKPTEKETEDYNVFYTALANLDDAIKSPPKHLSFEELSKYTEMLLNKKSNTQKEMRTFMANYTKNHKFLNNNVDFDGQDFFINYWHSPNCSLKQ